MRPEFHSQPPGVIAHPQTVVVSPMTDRLTCLAHAVPRALDGVSLIQLAWVAKLAGVVNAVPFHRYRETDTSLCRMATLRNRLEGLGFELEQEGPQPQANIVGAWTADHDLFETGKAEDQPKSFWARRGDVRIRLQLGRAGEAAPEKRQVSPLSSLPRRLPRQLIGRYHRPGTQIWPEIRKTAEEQRVSSLQKGKYPPRLATVSSFVQGLGGTLDVYAVFDGNRQWVQLSEGGSPGTRLADVRALVDLSRQKLAERANMYPALLRQVENTRLDESARPRGIDALARAVSALGGRLELVANFPDESCLVELPVLQSVIPVAST